MRRGTVGEAGCCRWDSAHQVVDMTEDELVNSTLFIVFCCSTTSHKHSS